MIGQNMARSEAAAAVDYIEIDTLQKNHKFAGVDISDYDYNALNGIDITTMDGKVHSFGGNISTYIVFK